MKQPGIQTPGAILRPLLVGFFFAGVALGADLGRPAGTTTGQASADTVIVDARVYTADAGQVAEALAIRGSRIVFVGTARGARRFIGAHTRVLHLGQRLVIPGLVDAHIHPLDIVDFDVCDLKSTPKTLRELSAFVADCVQRYHPAPGQWLNVHQWNPSDGNQTDAAYPTLRAALDQAAPANPVQLLGNDGHHGAYNSLALAAAKDSTGRVVGLSARTLQGELAASATLVGVDANGEPTGAVNEDARYLINSNAMLYTELEQVSREPQRVPQRLNSVGITAVLDAMAAPEGLPVYDALLARKQMTLRVNLAQFYDPSRTRGSDGRVDYDGMVARAVAVRARYANNPWVRADFIKLFADGVAEGDPFAVPPQLGNAAMIAPYLQPIFGLDAEHHATVTGYVDPDSPACQAARAQPQTLSDAAGRAAFARLNGFPPAQCVVSYGQLQHTREIELEYVRRMHLAGFNLHIHAIGDRAVRTAIDAIEAARAADGNSTTHDGLAHVQFSQPEDIARAGRDHLFLAYTYSWASIDLDYDMTIIPFVQRMQGNSLESRHVPGSWYEENTYPVRTSQRAGAILVAGSDAPVGTRDPQPFVNLAAAVTRHLRGQGALNPNQAISVREALDAYTINGARMLGREAQIGSLTVGKSADFVILDRDILALADSGHAEDIDQTQVLETWFCGRRVYQRPH